MTENIYQEIKNRIFSPKPRPQPLPGTYAGPLQIALGSILLAVFGGISLGMGITSFVFRPVSAALFALTMIGECIFLPLTFLSGYLVWRGIRTCTRNVRLRQYMDLWKGKSYIMLSQLRDQCDYPLLKIKKDIRYALDSHLVPGAMMDQEQTCLMLNAEAIELYNNAKAAQKIREEEERMKREAEPLWNQTSESERQREEFRRQMEDALVRLRQYHSIIQSEEMLHKLSELERNTTRIFVCVDSHPDKIPQTYRLVHYYLPSVINLFRVYSDLEKQPVQGDNIAGSREEISQAVDTMNSALLRMYDDLFQEDVLDVSADIQVLSTMLAQDGYMDSPFTPNKDKEEAIL